jgi:mevalonate pyrophosphate decarboxylase
MRSLVLACRGKIEAKAQIAAVSQIVRGMSGSGGRTGRSQERVLGVEGAGSDVEWQSGKR